MIEFIAFFEIVVEHAHQLSDKVAMTMTLANDDMNTTLTNSIITLSDIVTMNWYGESGAGQTEIEWTASFNEMLSHVRFVSFLFSHSFY